MHNLGFTFRQEQEFFLFCWTYGPALGAVPTRIRWVQSLFSGVKRPGRETDHSPTSSAEVKNELSYTSFPPICLHSVDRHTTVPYFPGLLFPSSFFCTCNITGLSLTKWYSVLYLVLFIHQIRTAILAHHVLLVTPTTPNIWALSFSPLFQTPFNFMDC
jgi:hypothetical protein